MLRTINIDFNRPTSFSNRPKKVKAQSIIKKLSLICVHPLFPIFVIGFLLLYTQPFVKHPWEKIFPDHLCNLHMWRLWVRGPPCSKRRGDWKQVVNRKMAEAKKKVCVKIHGYILHIRQAIRQLFVGNSWYKYYENSPVYISF